VQALVRLVGVEELERGLAGAGVDVGAVGARDRCPPTPLSGNCRHSAAAGVKPMS
jgi:hypothetical protein